jgi:uncharacterized protein
MFQAHSISRRVTLSAWAVAAVLTLPSAALAQAAASSAAKKELVAKVLQLQQPAIDAIATQLAQQPAAQLMQGAGIALQTKVAPDKREAIAKEIQADVKKYADESVPLLRANATKLAPSTIGVLIDERFTEDELKQLIAIMESPINRKFGQMNGELQKSLGEKLVAESRATIEPKIKALEQTVAKRLGLPEAGAPAAPDAKGAKAPAKAASK